MIPPPSGITRVILCADGDSRDINLWSNIPCLLGAEVESRGIELIRVNLQAPWLLRRIWRYTLGLRHKLRHWHTSYDFYRSRTNHWLTTRRLNQALRRHGGPDTILINLSISFAPTSSTIPVVLLSDWSYHHYITERLGREPDRSEQATIARDTAAMARASLVVLLFPESAARLQRQIPSARFRFLGHVINDHPLAPPPPPDPPAADPHCPWRLLFVGRPRYQEGLQLLLQALSFLPADLPVQLDVIGMSPDNLEHAPGADQAVRFHGYLSKADPTQRNLYYSLLNQADLLINAASLWGGISATIEAMYRKTAVVTVPYTEFKALFGSTISFGDYIDMTAPVALAAVINTQLKDPINLAQKQHAGQGSAIEFTWQAFVDRLFKELKIITSIGK